MHVLARFAGSSGEIRVLEDRVTGARLYEEGGVAQSRVLPGGEADVDYVRLMCALLAESSDALLLGCGGGSLATMLHRRGSRVAVVDANPISFQLARTFFWMPNGIECITGDMCSFLRAQRRTFAAIGVDVGGPCFSYEAVLGSATIARMRHALRGGGRVAVNISCETPDDPVPGRIADRFATEGLDVWAFTENPSANELNMVILASARAENPSDLVQIAAEGWALAHLV